jgi:hypothetical protein
MFPSFFITRQVRTTKLGILGLFGIHPFGALAVPLGQGPEKPVVSVAHDSSQEMPLKDPITGLPLPSTLPQIAFIPTTNRQHRNANKVFGSVSQFAPTVSFLRWPVLRRLRR